MNIAHVTYCENVALVTLRNVPSEGTLIADIFTAISDGGINVDMISQTAPQGGAISLAFTVSTDSVGALLPILNGFKPATPALGVELTAGMTKLNFSDEGMVHTSRRSSRRILRSFLRRRQFHHDYHLHCGHFPSDSCPSAGDSADAVQKCVLSPAGGSGI